MSNQENCPDAASTVEYVERCPTSEAEVKLASEKKNCDLYAKNQTCTSPEKFKFHCVVNTFLNETISVCAPQLNIKGNGMFGLIFAALYTAVLKYCELTWDIELLVENMFMTSNIYIPISKL